MLLKTIFVKNTFSFVVTQPDLIQVTENIQNVSCYNGSDGVVVLDISGGTFVYRRLEWL